MELIVPQLQEAALMCLAALVRDDTAVASALTRCDRESTMTIVLHLTRSKFTDVEIAASLCASHIIRASRSSTHTHAHNPPSVHSYGSAYGHIPASTANDQSIRTVMNVVERLMSLSPSDAPTTLTRACYVLYYLVADDNDLCRMAHERRLLDQALALLEATKPPSPSPDAMDVDTVLDPDPPTTAALREAALILIATLALASPIIRTELTDDPTVLPLVLLCLASPHVGTRYGACQAVRALSRSVAATRTSLVDSGVGLAVFGLLRRGEDRRVRGAALRAVCNLVVEFSPLRTVFLEGGLMERVMEFVRSADPPLHLGALWAIKNLLHRAPLDQVRSTLRTFGWDRLTELLTDEDAEVREQALHIVKNVTETTAGVDLALHKIGERELLTALCEALAASSDDVVLQAVCVVSNLANGTAPQQDALFAHPQLLGLLRACLGERSAGLGERAPSARGASSGRSAAGGSERAAAIRRPALGAVLALAHASHERRRAMVEAGLLSTLQHICERTGTGAGRWEHVPRDELEQARAAVDWLEHGDFYE